MRLLLAVDRVPPQQNRFFATRDAAIRAVATEAEFLWCDACLHIAVEKKRALEFDPDYDNRQSHSPTAKAHLALVAQRLARRVPLSARVVEIGCGRGEFLAELEAEGFSDASGYDPAAPESTPKIHNAYWRADAHGGDVDCLILRHTLEETPDFLGFLGEIASALSASGRLYIEITNAARIFASGNLWSLYPEYFNLFSVHSLSQALAKAGMTVDAVDEYAGGDWLGIWARRMSPPALYPVSDSQLDALAATIAGLPRPIVVWGASGRGGNLLAFLKLERSVIAYVVDSNEGKWGKYIPPYGQEVISPAELAALKPATVLLATAKFREEIRSSLPEGCLLVAFDELI